MRRGRKPRGISASDEIVQVEELTILLFLNFQFWGNLYHIHHTKMVTKEEVGRWWLDKNTKPDPRGQSPNILCVYNYKVQKWMTVMEMMKKWK